MNVLEWPPDGYDSLAGSICRPNASIAGGVCANSNTRVRSACWCGTATAAWKSSCLCRATGFGCRWVRFRIQSARTPGADRDVSARRRSQPSPRLRKQNRETVVELTLTNGPTATLDDGAYQWFELSFTKRNGQRFKLWILIDRLPGSSRPARRPLRVVRAGLGATAEYVHSKTERALLPKLGLFSPRLATGRQRAHRARVRLPRAGPLSGLSFKQTATGNEAPCVVPSAKVLRLNPDLTVFTIDAFRYLAPARHHLGENERPFTPDKYRKLTADDVREMIRMGVSLMNDHHHTRNVLDVWQEPVFVFDTARPWPEVLYRSNYYGLRWHLNEPAVHHSAKYVNQPDVIATWKPSQVAQSLLSEVEGVHDNLEGLWNLAGTGNNYGLGDLEKYHQRLMSWDQAPGAIWYQMLGLADGVVKEHAPGADVPYLNMSTRSRSPTRNATALL